MECTAGKYFFIFVIVYIFILLILYTFIFVIVYICYLRALYLFLFKRLMIAALHFNENSARPSARTKEGDVQYKISFPKFKQGEYTVRKKSVEATYGKHLVFLLPFYK